MINDQLVDELEMMKTRLKNQKGQVDPQHVRYDQVMAIFDRVDAAIGKTISNIHHLQPEERLQVVERLNELQFKIYHEIEQKIMELKEMTQPVTIITPRKGPKYVH